MRRAVNAACVILMVIGDTSLLTHVAWIGRGNHPRKRNAQPKLGVDTRKAQPFAGLGKRR
ncbi:hypothetical protein WAE31_17850 (plasmid) [Xanthomonas axonopodis pv. vasculorum]